MKRRKRAGSSMIFLTELLLAVFIFTTASAVCVQIFVKAKLLSEQADALQQAASVCTSAAEMVSSVDSMEEAEQELQEIWPEAKESTAEEGTYEISYEDGAYMQTIHFSEEDNMLTCEQDYIRTSDGTSVYKLVTKNYLERKRG